MLGTRAALALGTWLALGSLGCASSARNLKPGNIPTNQAALFGHIEIINQGEDVTKKCYLGLTDSAERAKANLSLDDSGWVFTTVTPGTTYLSSFMCTLGGVVKYNGGFQTRAISFDAPGKGKIAYFGHVLLDLHSDGGVVVPTLLFGAIGGALASMNDENKGQIDVTDHFEMAAREYQQRYGHRSGLVPVSSLAKKVVAAPAVATSHPPDDALGFALGNTSSAAQARCTEAKLEWQQLDATTCTCSGPAVEQAVPLKLTFTECDGHVCDIVADAANDTPPWSVLVSRFGSLSAKLTARYGQQFDRKTQVFETCTEGAQRCFAAGRARTSITWHWLNHQIVSLELDGGQGGKPTLRLHYGSVEREASQH